MIIIDNAQRTVFSHPPVDRPQDGEQADGESTGGAPVNYPELFREPGAQRSSGADRRPSFLAG